MDQRLIDYLKDLDSLITNEKDLLADRFRKFFRYSQDLLKAVKQPSIQAWIFAEFTDRHEKPYISKVVTPSGSGKFQQYLQAAQNRKNFWKIGPIGPHVQELIRLCDNGEWDIHQDKAIRNKDTCIEVLNKFKDSTETWEEILAKSEPIAKVLDMSFNSYYERSPHRLRVVSSDDE